MFVGYSEGKILAEGTVNQLIKQHGGEYEIIIQQPKAKTVINSSNPVQALAQHEIDPNTDFIEVRPPNLEQVFFNLTGKQLRD